MYVTERNTVIYYCYIIKVSVWDSGNLSLRALQLTNMSTKTTQYHYVCNIKMFPEDSAPGPGGNYRRGPLAVELRLPHACQQEVPVSHGPFL